jgi:hypothetical protein
LHSGWLLASSLYIDRRPLSVVEKLRFGPLECRLSRFVADFEIDTVKELSLRGVGDDEELVCSGVQILTEGFLHSKA